MADSDEENYFDNGERKPASGPDVYLLDDEREAEREAEVPPLRLSAILVARRDATRRHREEGGRGGWGGH